MKFYSALFVFLTLFSCGKNELVVSPEVTQKDQPTDDLALVEASKDIRTLEKNIPMDDEDDSVDSEVATSKKRYYKDLNFVGEAAPECDSLGCDVKLEAHGSTFIISSYEKDFLREYSLENFTNYFNSMTVSIAHPQGAPLEWQWNFFSPVKFDRWEKNVLYGSLDLDLNDACYIPGPTCCLGNPEGCPGQPPRDCVQRIGQESFHVSFAIRFPDTDI